MELLLRPEEVPDDLLEYFEPVDADASKDVWRLGPEPYPEAHFACADDQTECLTIEGWKRYNEVGVGSQIAAFDMESECLRWEPVEAMHSQCVLNQPMVSVTASSVDMVLTPDHRCVVYRRAMKGGYQKPIIKRADSLMHTDCIPTAGKWAESGEEFDLHWAELLGWYVTEGHESRNSMRVEISQSLTKNAPKVDRIRSLLNAVSAEYVEATGERDWRGKRVKQTYFQINGYAAARLREMAPGKVPPASLVGWNGQAIRAFLEGVIGGDGHLRADGRMSFVQKDKAIADLVHALAIRAGYSAVLSKRESGSVMWVIYFTKHNKRSLRGTKGNGAKNSIVHHTGAIWCPKVPSGTWVARRNGRVFITGNTFPSEIPRRAIKAGTSQKGVCTDCGAPWQRVVEEQGYAKHRPSAGNDPRSRSEDKQAKGSLGGHHGWQGNNLLKVPPKTTGWKAGCGCDAGDPVPATVLEPFCGSGTTPAVAQNLRRRWIGIELSPEYCDLAVRRIQDQAAQRRLAI